AQLQHTNIVPIYSVHQSGSLQVVCMPYFSSITLDRVIERLSSRPGQLPKTGRAFLEVLFSSSQPAAAGPRESGTPRSQAARLPSALPQSRSNRDLLARITHLNPALCIAAHIAGRLGP